jgi:hypothetical protein
MPGAADNPYVVLGVSKEATDDEIHAAWQVRVTAAAKAGHLRTAQRVDAAYELLRNPSRRAHFDRTGAVIESRRATPHVRYHPHAAPVPFRAWGPAQSVRAGRSSRGSQLLVILALAIAAAATLWQVGVLGRSARAVVLDDFGGGVTTMAGVDLPPVHGVGHPHRLLPLALAPAGSGGYKAQSARWNPCAPVHYVVSGVPPFPGADRLLRSAISTVSRATGLLFVYAGTTNETPTERRGPYQPLRYGRRWAPVLVAWTDADTIPRLAGTVVGLGGGDPAEPAGSVVRLVSGIVYLDAPDLATMRQRPTGRAEVRAVMLHELGHLVGLQHVSDPSAIMYPRESPTVPSYSPGDLRGLAHAGRGPCPTVA